MVRDLVAATSPTMDRPAEVKDAPPDGIPVGKCFGGKRLIQMAISSAGTPERKSSPSIMPISNVLKNRGAME